MRRLTRVWVVNMDNMDSQHSMVIQEIHLILGKVIAEDIKDKELGARSRPNVQNETVINYGRGSGDKMKYDTTFEFEVLERIFTLRFT